MRLVNAALLVLVCLQLVVLAQMLSVRPPDSTVKGNEPSAAADADPSLVDLAGFNPFTQNSLTAARQQTDLQSAESCASLSDVYLAYGFYPQSEWLMRQACRMEASNFELALRYGFVLSAMGRFSDARDAFLRSISLTQDQAREEAGWYFVARDWLRLEDVEQARQALERCGGLPAAELQLAKLDLRQGQAQRAKQRMLDLASDQGDAIEVHLLRAKVEDALGHHREAAAFRDLAELSTSTLDTPFTHMRRRFLQIVQDHSLGSFVQIQQAQLKAGNATAVVQRTQSLIGAHWNPQVEDLLATADFAAEHPQRQQTRLRQIISADGGSTYRCWRLGVAYRADGKHEQALAALRAGLRLDGRQRMAECRDQLIQLLEEQGDLGRARFHASRHAFLLGQRALTSGRVDEARDAFQQVVQMDESYALSWFYLGRCQRLLGQSADARTALRRCMDLEPDLGRAHDELLWLDN